MRCYYLISFLFSYLVNGGIIKHDSEGNTMVSSSCIGKEDGYYWLKMLDGDYPIVKVKCSNEYMMIDISVDANLKYYFSSFTYWHYALVGPTNDDHVSWDEWFLPAKADNSGSGFWSHSDDCSTCLTTAEGNAIDAKQTTKATTAAEEVYDISYDEQGYYMSGNMYGCFWWYRGIPSCDLEWDTYECNSCAAGPVFAMEYHIGMCASIVDSVHREAETEHLTCAQETTNKKPALGIKSSCMCYKPSSNTEQFASLLSTQLLDENTLESNLQGAPLGNEKLATEGRSSSSNVVYLTQDDFLTGTYRIRYPGTYILKEDITVDFNAGDETNPQLGDWWPTTDQAEEYPGVGDYHNQYFLGFFAGITVEADDVVIDLNQKTMKQSMGMYYQQRWYSHIELASSFFQPGQGPGFFGSNFTSAEHVTIKNGILDLSSHFGIHGNRNKNVIISNVIIRNFEIAGIHLNGFEDVSISDVEIGPSSTIAHLSGNYGHAQWAMPRLANILTEHPEASLTFVQKWNGKSRVVYLQDIYDRIEEMLKRAYLYSMFGTGDDAYAADDDIWIETKKWFINADGVPDGSAMHGLFLNSPGANVFTIGLSLWKSYTAKVENVYVHDLKHSPKHVVRFQDGVNFQLHAFNGPLPVEPISCDAKTGEDYDWSVAPIVNDLAYKGSTMSDMWFLLSEWETEWGPLQNTILETNLRNWAVNGDDFGSTWRLSCNADVMLHSTKGVFGVRLDGVDDVSMDNIKVERVVNIGAQASNACGSYVNGYDGGHFLQVTPPQSMGYSGTYAYGMIITQSIANIGVTSVSDIVSAYGLSTGVGIWHDNTINIQGEWNINDIRSGDYLQPGTLTFDQYPNNAAEACGVIVYSASLVDMDENFLDGVDFNDAIINYDNNISEDDIKVDCVRSESTCRNKGTSTMLGTISNCEYTSSSEWPEVLNTKPLYAFPTESDYSLTNEDDETTTATGNKHKKTDNNNNNNKKNNNNSKNKISYETSHDNDKDNKKIQQQDMKKDNDIKKQIKKEYKKYEMKENPYIKKHEIKHQMKSNVETKHEYQYNQKTSSSSSSKSSSSKWASFSIIMLMLSVILFAIAFSIYIYYKKSNNFKGKYQKVPLYDNYGSTVPTNA